MKKYFKYFNYSLLVIPVIITIIGILTLYSIHTADGSLFFEKQILWLIVSIIIFFVVSSINYEKFLQYSPHLYIITLVTLVYLIVFGEKIAGVRSWINLHVISLQPSEFTKLFVILLIAKIYKQYYKGPLNLKNFIKISTIVGLPAFFIVFQPDLGTAFTYIFILLAAFLIFGLRKGIIVLILIFTVGISLLSWNYVLKDYHKQRIKVFLNPQSDPLGYGYHTIQSKITIGSGGTWGKGYLNGTQKKLKFLPEQHSDFILSVYAEEFGFAGILVLIFLYSFLFYKIYKISQLCENTGTILITGVILGHLFFQFLTNIFVSLGKLPVAGITLPLFSYGGSSLITVYSMLGLVEGIFISKFKRL